VISIMTSTIVEPLLHAEHLTKSYGARPVLKDASLSIARGEIHALLGENGSGKSTLIKLLAGQIAPDGGYAPNRPPRVVVSGRSEDLPIDPKTAQGLKLGFVHQDLGLVLSSTVTETLGLGRFRTRWGMVNWRAQRSYTTEILQRYGLNLAPEEVVGSLSAVERAMLSIIRGIESISGDERGVLILDEPTAYLPGDAVHKVFDVLRRIRATGSSVLIVTHRLDEVKEICDRATILRAGEVVATMDIASVTPDDLVTAILGTELTNLYPQEHTTVAEPVLRVTNLSGTETRGVSFVASRGEILGLTGLVGDGFEEIISLCFGATRGAGEIELKGETVEQGWLRPRRAMGLGMAYIPADRTTSSGLMAASASENLTMATMGHYWRSGRMAHADERNEAMETLSRVGLQPLDPDLPLGSFSGGNQQKLILAKWLLTHPHVLFLHEPTNGVDVGAKKTLFELINRAAKDGCCVVIASSEYEDLAHLCHRVLIVKNGSVSRELSGNQLTTDAITHHCLTSTAVSPAA
jgi:ribose transport system ATP-binding protein